jgi:hypothetical protein
MVRRNFTGPGEREEKSIESTEKERNNHGLVLEIRNKERREGEST